MRRKLLTLVLLALVNSPGVSHSTLVGFEFVGELQFASDPPPFDLPAGSLNVPSEVRGKFFYFPSSQVTHTFPNCDGSCAGYLQQIKGGLSLSVDGIEFWSDEYLAIISNDVPGLLPNTVEDAISLRYEGSFGLSKPLVAGGNSFFDGALSIELNLFSHVLDGPELPTSIDFSDVLRAAIIAGDEGIDDLDLYSTLDDLDPLPVVSADYNLDGAVDPLDYECWRMAFGSLGNQVSDGNSDGVVDAADYTIWRDSAEFASSVGTLTADFVPEHNTMILSVLAVLFSLVVNRQLRS